MLDLIDRIRAAIRVDDWTEAWRLSAQLNAAIITSRVSSRQISPDLELSHVEMLAGKDATTRAPQLPRLARAAFNAHQLAKAEAYAREALDAATHGQFWWTGDAVHQGNTILGRLAARRGDLKAASEYLIASGKTTGSAVLGGLGPSMALANDLLQAGRWEPVVEYLEECKTFWTAGARRLAEWLALTRAHLIPDFGSNLDY